jgi:hypothetical protein
MDTLRSLDVWMWYTSVGVVTRACLCHLVIVNKKTKKKAITMLAWLTLLSHRGLPCWRDHYRLVEDLTWEIVFAIKTVRHVRSETKIRRYDQVFCFANPCSMIGRERASWSKMTQLIQTPSSDQWWIYRVCRLCPGIPWDPRKHYRIYMYFWKKKEEKKIPERSPNCRWLALRASSGRPWPRDGRPMWPTKPCSHGHVHA